MEKKLFSFEGVKFASSDEDTKTFSGYGAVFGNTDSYGDVIAPGAFKKSLKANSTPLMFLNHDLRSLPIGKWLDLSEDDYGLKIKGEFLDTAAGRDTHTAAKAGAITGLSIGYIPTEVKYGKPNTEEPARLIKAVDLFEVSVVTIPANAKARILDVKSLRDTIDFERELIALGMTMEEAKSFLHAYADNCETKYNHRANLIAANKLLSKLQGE